MAESFEFPEMKPFYYEAHPMNGEVWLRVSDEPRGRGSRWLVVDPHAGQARMLVELPEGTRPLSRSGDVLLLHHVDPTLDVVRLLAFTVPSG